MQDSLYCNYQRFFSFYEKLGAALWSLEKIQAVARHGTAKYYAGYLFFHFVLSFVRFWEYQLSEDIKFAATSASNGVWLIYSCFGIVAYCGSACYTEHINEFLENWKALELQILNGHQSSCKMWETRKCVYAKEHKSFRMLLIVEVVVLCVNITVLILNINGVPNLPSYPYTHLVHKFTWLWHPTMFLQVFYACIVTQFKSQLDVFCIAFASSTYTCLKTLSMICTNKDNCFEKTNKNVYLLDSSAQNCKLSSVEFAMENYLKLEELMNKFNGFFRWTLILYKGVALLVVTLMAFIAIRRRPGTPATAVIVFYASSILLCSRFFMLGYFMGRVYPASEEFIKSTVDRLCEQPIFKRRIWLQLQSYEPFGFRSGEFYVLEPHTSLVFFSVVLSYLVVTLQFE